MNVWGNQKGGRQEYFAKILEQTEEILVGGVSSAVDSVNKKLYCSELFSFSPSPGGEHSLESGVCFFFVLSWLLEAE